MVKEVELPSAANAEEKIKWFDRKQAGQSPLSDVVAVDQNSAPDAPSSDSPTTTAAVIASHARDVCQTLEREPARLVDQYRELSEEPNREPGEAERLEKLVTGVLGKLFDTRQKLQRAELDDFRRRLVAIEHQIEDRERMKGEIVQRRVEELIRPHQRTTGQIEAALDKKGNVESFRQANTLKELAEVFTKQLGVPVTIDKRSLEDIGFDLDSDVRIPERLDGTTIRSVLRQTLAHSSLDYTLADGAIVITSPEEADFRLDSRVYSIGHLSTPAEDLVETILSTVSPQSWVKQGGPGSICVLVEGERLAINQTQRVHAQVTELLKLMGTSSGHVPATI